MRPYKGLYELIEAFDKLNKPQTKLLIVGKPLNNEMIDKIRNKCKANKNILPIFKFVPDYEVQVYINAADILIYTCNKSFFSPSQLPGGVVLAMSFSKPIIAPAIGCIPDVLDSKGSFMYDPLEKEGLFNAIKKSLSSDLKKMGKHNFELANQLQWDKIAKKTYDAYKS